jgi:hypothetical protein
MTTPVKAVKKAAKPAGPPLDLTALTVTDAAAPARSGGRGLRDNPFTTFLAQSAANATPSADGAWKGSGKAVVVPAANVTEVANLIRYAANQKGLGSAISYDTSSREPIEPKSGWNYGVKDVPAGQVRVRFCAKSRKQRTTKTDDGISA